MSDSYLLILGAPRSGTTLLAAMIGCHSETAILNEDLGTSTSKLISKSILGNKLCIPNHIEINKKNKFSFLFGPYVHNKLYSLGYFTYRPESIYSINDYINAFYPLKIVGIIRDGNSVISSIMRRGEQTFEAASYRWCRSIDILHDLYHNNDIETFLLTFDGLVQDPERSMRRVTDFLDLPYEPQMLEGYAHTPNYSNASIDPGRSSKNQENKPDFNLSHQFPESISKYKNLINISNI